MKTIHPYNNWYIVDNKGFINKLTENNKEDAMLIADFCDIDYPQDAPHKAMQLVDSEIASDLYEACKALIAYCDKNPPMGESLWSVQLIRAAIAKAEGKLGAADTKITF